jgi:hypothetical protein
MKVTNRSSTSPATKSGPLIENAWNVIPAAWLGSVASRSAAPTNDASGAPDVATSDGDGLATGEADA